MFTLHVISDLNLGFNETSAFDENIPDVDLVILAGNLGFLKRSALFAETLAKKYPSTQFFWGWGETERYSVNVEKFDGEIEQSTKFRVNNHPNFPQNLHWTFNDRLFITLRNGQTIDLFFAYGFPYILSYEGDWEDTHWFKNYIMHIEHDTKDFVYKPKETSNVRHGGVPIWASVDWINEKYEQTLIKIRKWENEKTNYKILVTHINQYNDTRLINQKFYPYKIHLNNMAWVTSNSTVGSVNFLGAKLISNPGRGEIARRKIFTMDQ